MKAFFDVIRKEFGSLSANQVEGIEILLQATEGLPIRHRSYVLGTAWHETGPATSTLHMTPRREIWGPTPAQKRYEGREDLGNTLPGDGKRFAGRGFVQITGRANYTKASRLVGKDLAANPDLALQPDIAAKIMVDGMKNGWFTGKKMSDYDSYVNMRRVVNGTDRADLVAGYAEKFEAGLKVLQARPPVAVAPAPAPSEPATPEPPVAPPAPPPETPGKSIAGALLGGLGLLIAALVAWLMKG